VFRLPVHEAHHATWLPWVATATAVMGLVAAYYLYVMFTDLPGRLSARMRPLQRVLEAKWGFDLAFNWLVSRGVVAGSEGLLWRRFDVAVIDGAVNGVARFVNGVSAQARVVQTGLVRGYALVILGGAVTLLAYLLWM
jgi:NADH-quinone oxidoreductase subunit L